LNPKEFGVYNYVFAIASLIISFGDFGVSTAASKWTAWYNVKEKVKVDLVPFNAGIVALFVTVTVTSILAVFVRVFPAEKNTYIPWIFPFVIFVPVTSIFDGFYRGLKKFKLLSIINLSVGVLGLIILYSLISKIGVIGAILGQNVFYLMLFVVLLAKSKKLKFNFDSTIIKDLSKDFFFIGFATFGYFLYTRVDVLILAQFNYIEEIAYYEVVIRTFMFFALPFSVIGQITAPDIAALAAKGHTELILIKLKKYFFIVIICSLLLTMIFLYISPLIIKKYLPVYYAPAMVTAISILSFLLISKIWGVVVSQGFLVGAGYSKILAIFTIGGGFLNIIMDYILITIMGFKGVFVSTLFVHTIAIFCSTMCFYILLKRKISFSCKKLV
jgi:O-antigen/teichoic acid export membrane protein